jgi:hypothetical protein
LKEGTQILNDFYKEGEVHLYFAEISKTHQQQVKNKEKWRMGHIDLNQGTWLHKIPCNNLKPNEK